MRHDLRAAGTATTVAGASQFLTAAFYVALLAWVPDRVSDLFFFVSAWTLAAPLVVSTGVMYPLWLRGLAMTSRSWHRAALASVVLCLLGGLVSAVLTSTARGLSASDVVLIALITTSSLVTAALLLCAWFLGSSGRASWPNSVMAAPSALALGGLFLLRDTRWEVHGAVVAQVLATAVLTVVAAQQARKVAHTPPAEPTSATVLRLLGRSSTGYGLGLATQAAALALPVGALTLYNVLSRGTAAAVSVIVNAGLPALVHRDRQPSRHFWSLMNLIVASSLGVAAAVACIAPRWLGQQWVVSGVICALLIGCSALNGMTQLMALHAGDERAVSRVVVVTSGGILAVGLVALTPALAVPTLLATSAVVELVGAVAAAHASPRRWATVRTAAPLAIGLALVLWWS